MRRAQRRRDAGSAFTLIELIAVMLIMAIVTGITVASFTGLGRGAATSGGARNVMAAIRLARQYAVSRRMPVAFLVCDNNFLNDYASYCTADTSNWVGRAYAIWNVKQREYMMGWTELPQNVFFAHGDGTSLGYSLPAGDNLCSGNRQFGSGCIVPYENWDKKETRIPFPASYSTNTLCLLYGMVFEPNGQKKLYGTQNNLWYHWLLFEEGNRDPATGAFVRRPNSRAGTSLMVTRAGGVKFADATGGM